MDTVSPPLKRRRTSHDRSTPSRSQSRERDLPFRRSPIDGRLKHDDERTKGRTSPGSRSRDRSMEKDSYLQGNDLKLRSRRSHSRHSSDYSLPRRRRDARSTTPSHSQSRSSSRSRSYHSFPSPEPPQERRLSHAVNDETHTNGSATLQFKLLHTLPRAHARGITCVRFSPDRSLLACASADSTITIYMVTPSHPSQPLKHLRTLRAHLAGVNAIAWSPVGPNYTLASASDDKSILLWSPLSSDFPISPSPLIGHSNYVFSLAFSPKGNMLVSGSYDEAVFLWDVRSARVMRTLPAHSDPVSGVDFLRDGSMVCSCASDGLIRIWDSGTGQCLKTLVDEDRKPVTSVRFSPNGQFVLGWGLDGCIRLWRYAAGKCVKTYTGHVNAEYSLGGTIGDYNRGEDAFVVSGSEDGDLVVWDVSSKEVLWRGKSHSDVVLSVDFARNGRNRRGKGLLVSGGRDRDLRLWIEDREDDDDDEEENGYADDQGTAYVDASFAPELNGQEQQQFLPAQQVNGDSLIEHGASTAIGDDNANKNTGKEAIDRETTKEVDIKMEKGES